MTDPGTEGLRKAAVQHAWRSASAGAEGRRLKLAYARLPASMAAASRRFREITGHTAVTTIVSPVRALAEGGPPRPPVHPRCAEILSTVTDSPCEDQWQQHIRNSLRSRSVHSHVCPLDLHCSCVPVYLGDSLVGVAKMVLDGDTPAAEASAAAATLALTVDLACQESYVSVLREELAALRSRVSGLEKMSSTAAATGDAAARAGTPGDVETTVASGSIVERALDHIHRHYREPVLPLESAAAAAGCSEKYLARVFRQVVGQRMRSYITGLRVEDACRALLETDRPIKVLAVDCGFRGPGRLGRAFRQRVGVSPSVYRRIFRGG